MVYTDYKLVKGSLKIVTLYDENDVVLDNKRVSMKAVAIDDADPEVQIVDVSFEWDSVNGTPAERLTIFKQAVLNDITNRLTEPNDTLVDQILANL